MGIIDVKVLLDHYDKELYPLFKKHNSYYNKFSIFILEGDTIILTESTYDDTYNEHADCVRMTLITFDDNKYQYYHYNSISSLHFGEKWSYYDDEEFFSHNIDLTKQENKIKIILKKCLKYYEMIIKITYYDIYIDIDNNYKNYINKNIFIQQAVQKIIYDYKLTNTKKTVKAFGIISPFISFLNDNNILFDWDHICIIKYKQPIIILRTKTTGMLIEIKDFEEIDNKIIDLRTNKDPLENIIAYYNNRKAKISKIMNLTSLIGEILKIDVYAKKLLDSQIFSHEKWFKT